MFKALSMLCIVLVFASCGNEKKGETQIVEVDRPIFVPVPPDREPPPVRPPPRPGFIALDALENAMSLDLRSLSGDQERLETRYLIGCNFSNQNRDTDDFQQGVDLALNRLSSEIALVNTTPIGSSDCIYRLNLNDFTLTFSDWILLEDNAILDFVTKSIRGQELQFLTRTRKPYLFAQDALCVAFNCDAIVEQGSFYYKLTGQANNTDDFFFQNGIVQQREVDAERALFAGFSQSQIALGKTRLIQVMEQRAGGTGSICMTTYDTALGGDDLFINPFTLQQTQAQGILRSRKLFAHDAQEHICTLPNGLTSWRLNNANDDAETVAPTNIVTNLEEFRIDPAIRLGSCGRCHYNVIIPFADQLGRFIESNSNFDALEKDLGRVFFGRQDRLQGELDNMNRINSQSLQELGINAAEDPISTVLYDDIRKEMDITQVAAFSFITVDEFRARLQGSTISSQVFGNLLGGGTVSLATLQGNFAVLVDELGLFDDEDL
jgi:hypothetical protein